MCVIDVPKRHILRATMARVNFTSTGQRNPAIVALNTREIQFRRAFRIFFGEN
jgi:hypothetical protein